MPPALPAVRRWASACTYRKNGRTTRRDSAQRACQMTFPFSRLALALIDQALGWSLTPPPVVLADAGYGENGAFRQGLEQRHRPYAVGISSQVSVWTTPPECGVPDWDGQGRPTK